MHHGSEKQVRSLTRSLYNYRKARRILYELKLEAKTIKTAVEMAHANADLRQAQADASVCADSAGVPSLSSPISASTVISPRAESTIGENLSPLEDLIISAERDVEATAAKLAADAAAASAELAASQAAGSPIPPLPSAALKEPERAQLKLSGPLMQVPETVLRVFHLYEEKHVQPLLERLTLLRWWMQRWSWLSHVKLRARLRIEIKVLEIEVLETEIETLKLEVESIRLGILCQRDPVPACNPNVKMLRERKVKERIRTFRIKRLAAWAEELDADEPEEQMEELDADEPEKQMAQKVERYRAARFFQDDFVPMFDLRHSKTWEFVFVGYFDRRVRATVPGPCHS
jgi:hypothetical protein